MKRLMLFTFLSIILLTASCAPACDTDTYRTNVEPLLAEWDDAIAIANQTPRMSLPERIGELQNIQRKVKALQVDECLAPAHAHLIAAMDGVISGFLAFLGQEEDTVVQVLFDKADSEMEQYIDALTALDNE